MGTTRGFFAGEKDNKQQPAQPIKEVLSFLKVIIYNGSKNYEELKNIIKKRHIDMDGKHYRC